MRTKNITVPSLAQAPEKQDPQSLLYSKPTDNDEQPRNAFSDSPAAIVPAGASNRQGRKESPKRRNDGYATSKPRTPSALNPQVADESSEQIQFALTAPSMWINRPRDHSLVSHENVSDNAIACLAGCVPCHSAASPLGSDCAFDHGADLVPEAMDEGG